MLAHQTKIRSTVMHDTNENTCVNNECESGSLNAYFSCFLTTLFTKKLLNVFLTSELRPAKHTSRLINSEGLCLCLLLDLDISSIFFEGPTFQKLFQICSIQLQIMAKNSIFLQSTLIFFFRRHFTFSESNLLYSLTGKYPL